MEKERRINWLSLLIKIIIIFVLALILIWIISKIVGGKKLSDTFRKNINNMEDVAVRYFQTIDLPQEKGKSIKITLEEMFDKKLIVSDKANKAASCDTKNSNAKITRKSKNYLIEVSLKCGNEKETISRKLSFKNCKNCKENPNYKKEENNSSSNDANSSANSENKTNNTVNNNSGNSTSNTTSTNSSTTGSNNSSGNGITYYEYVKETVTYSKWLSGNKTGEDIENKNEYYEAASKVYYTIGYLTKTEIAKRDTLTYTIKLNNVPNNSYYFTAIKNSNNFKSGDESKYINNDAITENMDNIKINQSDISKYSLKASNYTYTASPYYRKGSFYVDIDITIKNKNNINYNDEDIILIPLKLEIQFISNKMITTKPIGEYITMPYYRYVDKERNTIWSSETSLDGYTRTGRTK